MWLIWTLTAVGIVATVALVLADNATLANVVLAVVVLVVAAYQADVTVPSPAELWVERQAELGYSDLIFYRDTNAPGLPDGVQRPSEYLLQLHVAVANIGGRKGLLSKLQLLRFADEHGATVTLPEVPLPLQAHLYRLRSVQGQGRGVVSGPLMESEMTFLPLVLEPDEVVTLRFRSRRGIDWSDRWTLDALREVAVSLGRRITQAELQAVFRRGSEVVEQTIMVAVRAEQQAEYVHDLECLTEGFTQRPAMMAGRHIEVE